MRHQIKNLAQARFSCFWRMQKANNLAFCQGLERQRLQALPGPRSRAQPGEVAEPLTNKAVSSKPYAQ
jgi:hypothetical protein